MNTITIRHHLKERTKDKRRILFSIHPRKQMPQNWNEDRLEEALTQYVERSDLIKKLTQEHKAQGEQIRQHYEANTLSSCGLETHNVNVVSKTKIEYSDTYRRDKEKSKKEFEDREKEEIENFHDPNYDGPLQCKSIELNPFDHMKVALRKGADK
tara:strand:- start:544 stop:1008 length:465 start_codon:yes stop_codon:yes gene_type:complete